MSEVEELDGFKESYERFRKEIAKVIVGQDEVVKNVLISIFSQGHCLLVGVPGLAKTLLVQTIAQSLTLLFLQVLLQEQQLLIQRMIVFMKVMKPPLLQLLVLPQWDQLLRMEHNRKQLL